LQQVRGAKIDHAPKMQEMHHRYARLTSQHEAMAARLTEEIQQLEKAKI